MVIDLNNWKDEATVAQDSKDGMIGSGKQNQKFRHCTNSLSKEFEKPYTPIRCVEGCIMYIPT